MSALQSHDIIDTPVEGNMDRYILDENKNVVRVPHEEWVASQNDNYQVALEQLQGGTTVSTIFIGTDMGDGEGEPLVFETMIFGGVRGYECCRYSTWKGAEAGHRRIVESLKDTERFDPSRINDDRRLDT